MKRKMKIALLSFGTAFLCLLCCACAYAEADRTIEYVGGVIERGNCKGPGQFFSLADELTVAYVSPQNGELTPGELSVWEVIAEGGTEPYIFEYALYSKHFSDSSNSYALVEGSVQKNQNSTFAFAVPEDGWYILMFTITDANGDYVKFQSSRFATSSPEVRQAVAEVVQQYLTAGMNDYEKAIVLHDYLCETAEYDVLSNIHEPDGVLLQGKGVCESFALAYQMLLGKAGVESIYVEGRGGLAAHAWNLVKLDNEWYHVDVTWDENRTDRYYFGLNDTLIKRSHTITSRVPTAEGVRYNTALHASDAAFHSVNELMALFKSLPSGQKTFKFYYTGKGAIRSQFDEWCRKYANVVCFQSSGDEWNGWHTMYVYGTIQEIKTGKIIETEAFAGMEITKIFLTNDYYQIAERAFTDCAGLKEIHIPALACSIADDAFEGCEGVAIYAPAGSDAAAYAAAKRITWVDEPIEAK